MKEYIGCLLIPWLKGNYLAAVAQIHSIHSNTKKDKSDVYFATPAFFLSWTPCMVPLLARTVYL